MFSATRIQTSLLGTTLLSLNKEGEHKGGSTQATICPKAIIYRLSPEVPQSPSLKSHSQYDGQYLICGLSTASEVFLIFTTQLFLMYL